jgi:ribA/ribD-fused uncharacterized protein
MAIKFNSRSGVKEYSNMFERTFNLGGSTWKSTEHYFQAHKAVHKDDAERIWGLKSPFDAKKEGKVIQERADWDQVKESVLLHALRAKFGQNPDLAQMLIATGDEELLEFAPWDRGDSYWGWPGQNRMGVLLSQVRDELQKGVRHAQVWTSRVQSYREDDGLDVSVMSGGLMGSVFGPAWPMVRNYKYGLLDKDGYVEQYLTMMRSSFHAHKHHWQEVLNRSVVTLLCYCPAGSFCHRHVLANLFEKCGAWYMGERQLA